MGDEDAIASLAASPGKPTEVLDRDMQVPATCGSASTYVPAEHGGELSAESSHSPNTALNNTQKEKHFTQQVNEGGTEEPNSKGHENRRRQLEKRVNMGDGKVYWQTLATKREEAMHTIGMVIEQRHDRYI